MRLTLQEMISGAITEATEREKLAHVAEGGGEENESPKASAKNEWPDEGKTTSISSDLVEKVASALDFINSNMGAVDWSQVKIAVGKPSPSQAANAPAPKGGPGVGPGSVVPTNMEAPTLGMQSTDTGQASHNQPEAAGSKDDVGKKDGQTNPDTALLTDMAHVPGGTGEQPQLHQEGDLGDAKTAGLGDFIGALKRNPRSDDLDRAFTSYEKKTGKSRHTMSQKQINEHLDATKRGVSKVAAARQLWAMSKQAADAENPAKIEAGKVPLENPNASGSEDSVPKQPGPFEKQRKMVNSNEAAINYTKGQAKADPKARMGEVLAEPAQKKSSDPVLHQNLDAASQAGVKISSVKAAAARAYLRKIAEAGEAEDASSEEKEKAEKLKSALRAKKDGKGGENGKEKGSMIPAAPGMGPVGGDAAPAPTPGI